MVAFKITDTEMRFSLCSVMFIFLLTLPHLPTTVSMLYGHTNTGTVLSALNLAVPSDNPLGSWAGSLHVSLGVISKTQACIL